MLNVIAVQKIMKEKGIRNRKELARLAKIPYSTITYMFQGNDIHLSNTVQLAKFFQVPVDDIVNSGYVVVSITEKGLKYLKTNNLKEAVMSIMM